MIGLKLEQPYRCWVEVLHEPKGSFIIQRIDGALLSGPALAPTCQWELAEPGQELRVFAQFLVIESGDRGVHATPLVNADGGHPQFLRHRFSRTLSECMRGRKPGTVRPK